MNPVVRLNSVNKLYGKLRAVNNLDLEIESGEILGLIGHNGAGKTTTLKMMVGLLTPTSGSIEILGQDITRDSTHVKKDIG